MIMLLRFASNEWSTLDLYLRKTSKTENKERSQAKVDTLINRRTVYALISRDNYDKFDGSDAETVQHHPINEPGECDSKERLQLQKDLR
jgi:hypothetical protein